MNTIANAPPNVSHMLIDEHIAETRGAQTAFKYNDKGYSFHDLAALANRTGNLLKKSGASGKAVLVAVPPSPAYVAAVLGAMKVGAVPVVVDGAIEPASVAAALGGAAPEIAVVHQDKLAALPAGAAAAKKVFVVGQNPGEHESFVERIREEPSSLSADAVSPETAALRVFNGKSVVALSHADLAAALRGKAAAGGATVTLLAALTKGEVPRLA
jgi:acyl-coenzyme A synthetase/AMP-(fatty) acid ligase